MAGGGVAIVELHDDVGTPHKPSQEEPRKAEGEASAKKGKAEKGGSDM